MEHIYPIGPILSSSYNLSFCNIKSEVICTLGIALLDMVRTVTMVRTDVTPSVTRAGDCVLGRRKVSQESTTMSPLGP